jgi:hypothetical protein
MSMWEVKLKNKIYVFFTLEEAMYQAQCEDEFVTITDGTTEIVGKFGVDAVENKTLPDGEAYTWTMRRDETHRSSRKKLV